MDARCPHCDAEAIYVGLSRLDCPTEGCPNHRDERPREPRQLEIDLETDLERFPLELLAEAHDFF
jgi:hypothetical protein